MSQIVRHILIEQQDANIKMEKLVRSMDKAINEIINKYVAPEFYQLAKKEFEKAHSSDEYRPKHGSAPVLNLDKEFWEHIKQAAAESEWIPKEYLMNDWVSDVCTFLREKRKK
jgi:glutaredoxin 2